MLHENIELSAAEQLVALRRELDAAIILLSFRKKNKRVRFTLPNVNLRRVSNPQPFD